MQQIATSWTSARGVERVLTTREPGESGDAFVARHNQSVAKLATEWPKV